MKSLNLFQVFRGEEWKSWEQNQACDVVCMNEQKLIAASELVKIVTCCKLIKWCVYVSAWWLVRRSK